LLLGILPLSAQFHIKVLTLYINILHRPGSAEHEVILRQLAMKTTSSNSWTTQLRKILHKYQLPTPTILANSPPRKGKWKQTVKTAVSTHWNKTLKVEAAAKKSLAYMNLNMCAVGYSHPVWVCGADPMQATMAATKATLLVGRYPVTGEKCAGTKQLPMCPLCHAKPETVCHFITECEPLQEHRERYMRQLQQALPELYSPPISAENLTKLILDPSHEDHDVETTLCLEEITRRMCYNLHNHRAIILGTGSLRGRAIKRYSWVRRGKRKSESSKTLKSRVQRAQQPTQR
jgi:hypothetical protein